MISCLPQPIFRSLTAIFSAIALSKSVTILTKSSFKLRYFPNDGVIEKKGIEYGIRRVTSLLQTIVAVLACLVAKNSEVQQHYNIERLVAIYVRIKLG